MNNLFDIACNFSSDRFDKDLDAVIERAKINNVNKFLIVSASLNDFEKTTISIKVISKKHSFQLEHTPIMQMRLMKNKLKT